MDLSKYLSSGDEPAVEEQQPRMSKEEYAALKKQEREEVWAEIDAKALGNGVYSLIISVARQLVCILPLAWFFARTFGLHAVWLSLPLAEITSVVLSSILFRKIYLDKIKPLGQAAA